MSELAEVVSSIKPDNFEPKIINKTDDYLYAEFQSPTFGVRPLELGHSSEQYQYQTLFCVLY